MNPRIIHLEAIIKTLCDTMDPALTSLQASIDQSENAIIPEKSTLDTRRVRLKKAQEFLVAARLELI